jgi:glycoside/pentoside/hexuronide:cation symporter, GPH family
MAQMFAEGSIRSLLESYPATPENQASGSAMSSDRPPRHAAVKIPFYQMAAFGVGGIIPIALFNIAGQLMALIGNIGLGLSAFWLGVIMIIPRLWDAVSDPLMGHLSDNTRSRWGRRRPYLLIGGIAVAISFVLMWWIPKGDIVHGWFPSETAYQWFQLGYILFWLLIFFTSCTIFEIPHGALGMEMSTDPHERTRLFSAKSFMGNLFAMGTPWLFALANMEVFKGAGGNEADGMRYVSLLIAAVLIPLSFWWFFTVREPGFAVAAKQEKSPFWQDIRKTAGNRNFLLLTGVVFTLAMGFNFVGLLGYYIPIFYIFGGDKEAAGTLLGINGTVWAVTGLLAVFPLNWISSRVGKRSTLLIAIFTMIAAQLSKIVCYNPAMPYLIVIPTILLSTGMLFFFTLGSSMVGDICDEDDLNSGKRSEGSYYSVFWWFIKTGTTFAGFVTGLLILVTQFDETQVKRVDGLIGSLKALQTLTENANREQELRNKLAQARSEAEKLNQHLQSRLGKFPDATAHNQQLADISSAVHQQLQDLDRQMQTLTSSPVLLRERTSNLLNQTVALTLQTPATLFWMRVIEISLPLLLCIVSILFLLPYSLTEEHSQEIKRALEQRNATFEGQESSGGP